MSTEVTQGARTVTILGGGPSACMLATLLARAGVGVTIIHKPSQAPLLVGESLVPAIVPMLRQLGVEDEVRSYSTLKPGATFNMSETLDFSFQFDQLSGAMPRYAYNVPRDKFDATLLKAALDAGAKIVETTATVERESSSDRVRLSDETLAAVGSSATQPDFIVDATGRARLLPNLLNIGCVEGDRKDTALFAHVDKTHLNYEGHVHTTRLEHGWSWRIPLPGRVSVGMVVGSEFLPEYGGTKEERFDNLLTADPALRNVTAGAKRLTPVLEYANYQLVSSRTTGPNWALVGDTAGFVDPVFSSGLFIGMHSAIELAGAILDGTPKAFVSYQQEVIHHIKTWHEIVSYFYDGRLFTCFEVGQSMMNNLFVKLSFPHINKHMGRVFSGAASTSPYSMGLLRFAMKYGLKDRDPAKLAIG